MWMKWRCQKQIGPLLLLFSARCVMEIISSSYYWGNFSCSRSFKITMSAHWILWNNIFLENPTWMWHQDKSAYKTRENFHAPTRSCNRYVLFPFISSTIRINLNDLVNSSLFNRWYSFSLCGQYEEEVKKYYT